MPTIQVERRSRYGRSCWLPVNPNARGIADIAGTTEVRSKDLKIAAQLGFTITRVERRDDGSLLEIETLQPAELKP